MFNTLSGWKSAYTSPLQFTIAFIQILFIACMFVTLTTSFKLWNIPNLTQVRSGEVQLKQASKTLLCNTSFWNSKITKEKINYEKIVSCAYKGN